MHEHGAELVLFHGLVETLSESVALKADECAGLRKICKSVLERSRSV